MDPTVGSMIFDYLSKNLTITLYITDEGNTSHLSWLITHQGLMMILSDRDAWRFNREGMSLGLFQVSLAPIALLNVVLASHKLSVLLSIVSIPFHLSQILTSLT